MRWKVNIHYRHDDGIRPCSFMLEELDDLAEIVEDGPHFATIDKIEILYRLSNSPMTVEQSEFA